jgi:hypothetical protein
MTNSIDLEKSFKDLKEKTQKLDWKIEDTGEYFEKQIRKITDRIIIWNKLSEYTIPFSYEKKINEINSFLDSTDYPDIVNTYRENSKWPHDNPYTFYGIPIKNNKWDELYIVNSTFLKNAQIFSDVSKTLYWDTRPILSYYSVSYLLSFFINSIAIFPQETKTHHHGLRLIFTDKIDNLKIKYHESGGLFHRIVKTFSFIFNGSIFSDYLIDYTDGTKRGKDQVELYNNSNIFSIEQEKEKSFLIKDLFELSTTKLIDSYNKIELRWMHTEMKKRYISSSILLKNYILIFAACSLARYNPFLWKKIYEGESSDYFLHYKNAIEYIEDMASFISDELERLEHKHRNGFRRSLWAY